MSTLPSPLPSTAAASSHERAATTLLAALQARDLRAAVTFAGNGTPWVPELRALVQACPAAWPMVAEAAERLRAFGLDQRVRWAGLVPDGFEVEGWISGTTPLPSAELLSSSTISQPGIFLAQVARIVQLQEAGLDLGALAVDAASGYSQGVMTAVLVSEAAHRGALTPERVADFAIYLAWQGLFMAECWKRGAPRGPGSAAAAQAGADDSSSPMVAISGPTHATLAPLVASVPTLRSADGRDAGLVISMANSRTRHVVSGAPAQLRRLHAALEARAARETAARKQGQHGGAVLRFTWDPLPVECAFHSPYMASGMEPMRDILAELGFRVHRDDLAFDVLDTCTGDNLRDAPDLLERLLELQYVEPVRWVAVTQAIARRKPDVVLDFGAGPGIARVTASGLRGHGVRLLSLSEPSGRRDLLSTDLRRLPKVSRYADFAPKLVQLADGSVHVDNAYTRATGQSPMILPGMTPTTADVPLVAAAANAGFTAELAGGGQVTERIFDLRMAELKEALNPGVEVTFNALFMDRYLWGLHFGSEKLVQKARKAGLPIGGVTISAGIPDVDEGVRLLDEFADLGMRLNAFKPGTAKQVDQVLAIADAAPHHAVFLHLEGGKAGGHHSWEDLEDLLLTCYDKIRQRPHVILCVGGGVADEARATALVTGSWSLGHGLPAMPVDAVLLGTVTMACLEAGTSPQVKAALAAAGGTPAWVPSGDVVGGVTSGKSQLDADIHYLDNAAAACGRLLDAVAGDAEAIASRKDEIVTALNRTAKPYFGDLLDMSWQQVLERAVSLLAVGRGGRYEDGVWPDVSYRARVADLLRLAEARLLGAEGVDAAASVLTDLGGLDRPQDVLAAFTARYPRASTQGPHPADVETFVRSICARPGKPVNFVPVIDADVRRWFKSDSLWQAHDDRFEADQVLTIPGPEAVRGIVRANEPVAELLGRFTQAVVGALQAAGETPTRRRWLATPRTAQRPNQGLPGGVRVDAGEGVATWAVAGDVADDCWFAPLAARYRGLVAQVFAAETVYMDGAALRNPVHGLCLAEPGASLWIEPAAGAAAALTWRSTATDEVVRLALDAQQETSGRVTLTLEVATLSGREGAAAEPAPLTRVFTVDAAGRVHLAPLTGAAVRAFYDAHLFGAPQQAAPLFAEAVDAATVQPRASQAYGRLSANVSEEVAGSQVFSLGFRAMMRALSCDELAPGLLSLVHLTHSVRPQTGWPLVPGETLTTSARIVHVTRDSGGAEVHALVRVLRGDTPVAEADEAFYLRGYDPGFAHASEAQLEAALWIGDEAAARFAQERLGLDEAPLVGHTLAVSGPVSERRDAAGVTFAGALRITDTDAHDPATDAELTTWTVDARHEGASAKRVGLHPARALADVLAPPSPRVATPEADLATEVVHAPTDLVTWSEVSGDANPIHRSLLVARSAGLPAPIVHGMWTAARARAFVVTTCCGGDASRLRGLEVRFVAPLSPGGELELRATRVAAEAGCEVIRVRAATHAGPALEAEATVAPPTTAYVFPGQGIQQPGMGMDAYNRSAAARAVWDAADAFTRAQLGFSLLHVVRDNPKELLCQGRRDVHKRGVLYLTQYTQVAMATLARAQVAELREAGALVDGAVVCGHSIGEYNALSAVAEVLPLETVVAVVWHRGLTMHTCVPRDAQGRSGYAMGVIRPHHAGLDHDGALALVAEVASETGGFVEIVNFNVRDRQYSTVGDLRTLAVLERRLNARQKPKGKAPWVTVPGIDVPFHSTRLRDGVPAFRATLQRLLPATGYLKLVGTYVPNLVAVPFALTPAFVEEMVAATATVDSQGQRVVAPEIQALRARFDRNGVLVGDPDDLARELVVELFAFQFASPVRWIESQDVLMRPVSAGGLGVQRFVEVGVGYQPTTANMAKQTLRALGDAAPAMTVLNIEADGDAVKLQSRGELPSRLSPVGEAAAESTPAPQDAPSQEQRVEAAEVQADAPAAAPVAQAAPAQATAAPVDQAVSHLDGLRTLLALQAKVRAEQIRPDETIDDVFGGVSSRRNQALVDMGAEFDAGAIDGAHEVPVGKLAALLAERAGGWRCPGGYLRKAQDEAVRRVFGRAGLNRDGLTEKLAQRYGLGAGLTAAALNALALEERGGDSARGEALGRLAGVVASSAADVEPVLDQVVAALAAQTGLALGPLTAGGAEGGGAAVDAAVVAELEARILGPNGVLAGSVQDLSERLTRAQGPSAAPASDAAELATLRAQQDALHGEHGEGWLAMVAPRFSPQQHVAFTSSWAWARRDVATLFHDVARGALAVDSAAAQDLAARLARFASDSVVADRARYFAGQASARGLDTLATTLNAVARGDALTRPSLVPSRPHVDVDASGRRSFREVADTAPDAVSRLASDLRAAAEGRRPHVQLDSERADAALWQALLADTPLDFRGRTALVTGASPGSIAVEVVRHLLRGGARVVVTTSSPRRARIAWYSALYQREAASGAELHVVPFNQASFQDVDALVSWLFDRVTEPDGAKVRELKGPFAPDLVVPFAALGDAATANTLGPRSEAAIRVMLTGVERLIAGIGARYAAQGAPARPAHVVLPLSPNHGGFGGDGAYAETKAGLEVLLNKWASERDAWAAATTLCAARIGWVRGTGLMDANDGVAAALEAQTGARTFANSEMGWLLAGLCTLGEHAADAPLEADLTGGFGRIPDIREVVSGIRADLDAESRTLRELSALNARADELLGGAAPSDAATPLVQALPAWPAAHPGTGPGQLARAAEPARWPEQGARLEDTVVIVGAGELGPCGSARTRWALEVDDQLSAAAVLELAWMCGLIAWREGARGGTWVDVASDSPVAEADIGDRYRDAVRDASGIRWTEPAMAGFDPDDLPVLATAWLDRDFTFDVANAEEAQAFVDADPEHTLAAERAGRWQVTRKAGAEVRVPRRAKLNRKVLGMLPTGLSYGRFGLPGDMVESVDRVTLMNLIATADAFLDAGLTPEELLAEVHPARVANTQGSGLGGMQSLRRLFTDQLLDRERQGDIVQEMLINVVAAYTVQSYVGSYGPMVHPVGACATAAVSLEEGMDKILSGRADFSVAGGFDDVTAEGVVGFSDMQATADTAKMSAMGLDPDQMSRANDLRRRGFVEAQGGGTLLLCRGDVARDLGLPVRGVLAWAGSFSDGVHTSIPAPGLGVVAAAMGGTRSPLGRALSRHGLTTDDIALIYKHDTSTAANDPNENLIHNTIQRALGRTAGNPLFVVSQKTLTGHSKGGAAAFQAIGLCQSLAQGTIAGNRNLECVDPDMRRFEHLAFTDRAVHSATPLRAGLVTSLGFGHVGAVALVLHPDAFAAQLAAEGTLAPWQERSAARETQAMRRRVDVLLGRAKLFERRSERPITEQEAELAMLLDPDGRIGAATGTEVQA